VAVEELLRLTSLVSIPTVRKEELAEVAEVVRESLELKPVTELPAEAVDLLEVALVDKVETCQTLETYNQEVLVLTLMLTEVAEAVAEEVRFTPQILLLLTKDLAVTVLRHRYCYTRNKIS
jgi:hypothetical protein